MDAQQKDNKKKVHGSDIFWFLFFLTYGVTAINEKRFTFGQLAGTYFDESNNTAIIIGAIFVIIGFIFIYLYFKTCYRKALYLLRRKNWTNIVYILWIACIFSSVLIDKITRMGLFLVFLIITTAIITYFYYKKIIE